MRRLLVAAVVLSSVGMFATPADAKPNTAPLPGMTRAELDAHRAAAIADANGTGVGSSTGTTTQATTMAVTGWINISASQGSINCVIHARQLGSNLWQTKMAAGACKSIYIETYRYGSDLMCDLDFRIPAKLGYVHESRCALKICYIYVYWRDSANVFRDVVFWDGGSQF